MFETIPINEPTKPMTKTLFIMSTLDVPAIAKDAKLLANSKEPIVGLIVVVPKNSLANRAISWPPSAVYATTIADNKNQNNAAVITSPGTPSAIFDMDKNPPPLLSSFSSLSICDASQLASNVSIDVTYVNSQHTDSPDIDGINPAANVSAGRAIIPAPTAVPANNKEAPAMLPLSLSS